jgi:hypothetical protein
LQISITPDAINLFDPATDKAVSGEK